MVCVAPEVSVAVPFPVVTSLRGGPPVGPKTSTANLKLVVVNEVQVNSVSRLPTLMTAGTVKTRRAAGPPGVRTGRGLSATPANDGGAPAIADANATAVTASLRNLMANSFSRSGLAASRRRATPFVSTAARRAARATPRAGRAGRRARAITESQATAVHSKVVPVWRRRHRFSSLAASHAVRFIVKQGNAGRSTLGRRFACDPSRAHSCMDEPCADTRGADPLGLIGGGAAVGRQEAAARGDEMKRQLA